MSVEALPFVNWIFWAALTAGTLLVVGVTELLGGTTRGYRLFMAWLLVAFAAVLLLSELSLSAGTALDASTAGTRRALMLAFVAVTVAYLIASMARLAALRPGDRRRAWSGSLALVTLAAGSPTFSPLLFSVQLVLAALALGAVNAAMLLGHWYLVTPEAVADAAAADDVAAAGRPAAAGRHLRGGGRDGQQRTAGRADRLAHLAAPGGRHPAADRHHGARDPGQPRRRRCRRAPACCTSAWRFVMAGSIAGASITYLTGVPV